MDFTIGELAREVGVPTSTLRYYERVDLLRPSGRSRSNYRLYSDQAVERVRFIRAAQGTGFSLADVAELIAARYGSNAPCRTVQALIEKRLFEIERRLADLHRTEAVLKSCLSICRKTRRKNVCKVLDGLVSRSISPSADR